MILSKCNSIAISISVTNIIKSNIKTYCYSSTGSYTYGQTTCNNDALMLWVSQYQYDC